VVALQHERDGKLAESRTLLERAVQLAPGDASCRNALGLCFMRLDQPADALQQFDALIGIDATLPFSHVNRGDALLALRKVEQAEASFRQALALDPHHAIAQARLARIAGNRGGYPAARMWANKALATLPGLPDAIIGLATAELGERELGAADRRISALLADPRLEPGERAQVQGLMGDIFDAQDRVAEAFDAYTRCNEALRGIHAARFGAHEARDFVAAMEAQLARTSAASWAPRAPTAEPSGVSGHVFVLGFPRSGTTLIEVILEGHPDVVSLEEQELLLDGVHEFMRRPEDLSRLSRASEAELAQFRDAYWQGVDAAGIKVRGKVFVDKHPLNSLKLPLLSRLFPRAKIILAGRDPRDVVLSCFRHRFRMSAPIYELLTLEGAARYYDAVMNLVIRARSVLPLDILLVRHEDLVTDFAAEVNRICTFLGIERAEAMGDFAKRGGARAVLTPSTAQLVRGLNTEGLGHWRRYREQLAPVFPLLASWVKRFYYAD